MCCRLVLILALALAGWHVDTQAETRRTGSTEQVQHPEQAVPGQPTLVLTDAGSLRFIGPWLGTTR